MVGRLVSCWLVPGGTMRWWVGWLVAGWFLVAPCDGRSVG